jgi:putative ABC transport system permease protein
MVLGHGLWQRRYGGDAGVVGSAVRFNGESWTVVGVMPPRFDFYGENNVHNDYFIPLGRLGDQDFMRDRHSHTVHVTARLRRGVEIGQAREQMDMLAARLGEQFPESNRGKGVRLRSFLEDYVGEARPALLMLMAAVGGVLLIACANVANLLLVRAASRRKEIALRVALGAGRWRVVRQLLTESLLLAAGGGALGLLLGAWGVRALVRLAPDVLPRMESISLDARAVGFTLLVTALTGVAFGLAPALQTSKAGLQGALKEGGAGSPRGGGRWLRSGLVVAEVALSLLLLVGAGLLLKSFARLMRVEPGFDARGVLTLRLRLPDAKYRDAASIGNFVREVARRVEALPGVERVSLATGFPFGRSADVGYWLEGEPEPRQPRDWPAADSQSVDGEFHRTLGINLLAGRYFDERNDRADSPAVVLVDEDFVRRHFPNGTPRDALGKRLRFGGEGEPWREIVGVVRHVRQDALDEEGRPAVYRHWTQLRPEVAADYTRAMDLIVKSTVEPGALVAAVRREVQSVDPEQPLGNVSTLEALVERTVAPRRFSLLLAGVFAGVALALGAVGLYGVLSYTVAQRSREIGIRMALGARRGDVHRLVISHGMRLALAGVAAGLLASVALTRLMSSLLFGVSATDPQTFLVIALLLLLVALAACYLPARRASKVDPLIALRYE